MTVLDAPIAPVTPLHRTPRSAVPDTRARLFAESNRLLTATSTSESTAQDALSNLIGSLLNSMPAGGVLSEADLHALIARAADRLGCPPAVVAPRRTRRAGR